MDERKANGRRKLTPKQAAFVAAYLLHFNASRAAREAGYALKTCRQIGQQNLSKPDIKRALAAAQAETAKRAELSIDDVRRMHQAVYVQAMKMRTVVRADGTKREVPTNLGAANKAAECLGKMIGAYTENHIIRGVGDARPTPVEFVRAPKRIELRSSGGDGNGRVAGKNGNGRLA